jgi:DEAD/DEAH box helicase domain-containing protein
MKKVILDIETQNTFAMVESSDPKDLDLSIMCIYESDTKKYSSYSIETLPTLWPILEAADLLVTYNGDHFDLPILNKYYNGDLTKFRHVDLLKEIQKVIGRRVGLDSVAQATLNKGKSGNGLEAITWWKKGEIQKIIDYCMMDVEVTKDVYEFALKEQKLFYMDNKEKRVVPLDTKPWEQTREQDVRMTYSLPF